jgi:putative flippase GtrA
VSTIPKGLRIVEKMFRFTGIRFLLVGAFNTFFGFGMFICALNVFQVPPSIALLISTGPAVFVGYVTQRQLVWRSKNRVRQELPRFITYTVCSTGVNYLVLLLLADVVGLSALFVQTCVTVLMVLITFVVHKRWTFFPHNHKRTMRVDRI